MSLKVQPAPRITRAPMPNRTISQMSRSVSTGRASAMAHQPGSSSSQVPIGRSSRDSRA
jgi:hypothetical protein